MQKPTMEWNTQKKIWQHLTDNHLFELWEPFLGTWPTSGMTVNGLVYALPMPERLTTDSESSSLPFLATPKARDCQPEGYEAGLRRSQPQLGTQMRAMVEANLPTPTVSDLYTANLASTQQKDGSLHSVTLAQVFHREDLFPTPTVFHVSMHDEPIDTFLAREEKSSTGQIGKSLGVALRMEMFPTPVASEGYKAPAQQDAETKGKTGQVWLSNEAKGLSNTGTGWGKFEPAIRRWEEVLGRPAPAPTKPDGKDGNHRLSSAFTEWMMGVPEGWITEAGISRNEELKAAGNGVVPQQAELALRILLDGVPLD